MSQSRSSRLRVAASILVLAGALPTTAAAGPLAGTSRVDGSSNLGSTLSAAQIIGDFNGDGIDDEAFAVGDLVTVVFGNRSGRGINLGQPGAGRRAFQGNGLIQTIGKAGDVDGDGYDDLLVSVVNRDETSVLYGGPGGAGTTAAITSSPRTAISTGAVQSQVSRAIGDVNGDGKDDLSIQRTAGLLTSLVNGSTIVLGGERVASINATAKGARTSLLNGTRKCTYIGVTPFCNSTMPYVTPVGDFDGDGKDDVIVSTQNITAYVLYGSTTTFTAQANSPAAGTTRLSRVGGGIGGPQGIWDAFTTQAGDVNGDGLGDAIVPAGNGFAILLGRAGQPAELPANTPVITLASKTPSVGIRPAGDQDGDGKDDLITSFQRGSLPAGTVPAIVLVTKLPAAGSTVDLDAAGRTQLAGLPTSVNHQLTRWSGPGDIDGDGAPDLIAHTNQTAYRLTHNLDRLPPELDNLKPQSLVKSVFYGPTGTSFSLSAVERTFAEFSYKTSAGVAVGKEQRTLASDANTIPFNGIVGGKTLAPGRYSVTITPFDTAGNRGRATTLPFTLTDSASSDAPPTARFRATWLDASGNKIPGIELYLEPRCGDPALYNGTIVGNGEFRAWAGRALDETDSCWGFAQVVGGLPAAYANCTWKVTTRFNGVTLAAEYTESRLKPNVNTWEQIHACVLPGV